MRTPTIGLLLSGANAVSTVDRVDKHLAVSTTPLSRSPNNRVGSVVSTANGNSSLWRKCSPRLKACPGLSTLQATGSATSIVSTIVLPNNTCASMGGSLISRAPATSKSTSSAGRNFANALHLLQTPTPRSCIRTGLGCPHQSHFQPRGKRPNSVS